MFSFCYNMVRPFHLHVLPWRHRRSKLGRPTQSTVQCTNWTAAMRVLTSQVSTTLSLFSAHFVTVRSTVATNTIVTTRHRQEAHTHGSDIIVYRFVKRIVRVPSTYCVHLNRSCNKRTKHKEQRTFHAPWPTPRTRVR